MNEREKGKETVQEFNSKPETENDKKREGGGQGGGGSSN